MTEALVERRIGCPFCGERMTVLLDLSAGDQSYIEDCQVCCRPMQISYETDDGMLLQVRVDRAA